MSIVINLERTFLQESAGAQDRQKDRQSVENPPHCKDRSVGKGRFSFS